MDGKQMRIRWINLLAAYASRLAIDKCYDDIIGRYSEGHRTYHTINHIACCLQALDDVRDHIHDIFCVELAIWFHDVIYDPKNSDNELKSAEFARECLIVMDVPKEKTGTIENYIRKTKHPSQPVLADEKYLVDIDLNILGASSDEYFIYEHAIRQEYSFISLDKYIIGRKQFLEAMLNKKSIYTTEYFRSKYEVQANVNIRKALILLECS